MPKSHSKPWTPAELKRTREMARRGMSSRQTAEELGRTPGAVKFKAMSEGIRFHFIKQPIGPQKRLGIRRRKYGMSATLSRRSA